jgi:TonB family protein
MFRLLVLLIAVPGVLSTNALQDKGTTQDPPVVVKRVDPVYPKPIPKDSAEGTVFIQLTVDAKGDVTEAGVLKADAGEAFQKAAVEAAKQWKFAPNEKGKKFTLVLPFKFKLADGKKDSPAKK